MKHVLQARPPSSQVLAVHQTAPMLHDRPRAVVATTAEPLTPGSTAPVREGQLEAASQASLNAMAQACQAADA